MKLHSNMESPDQFTDIPDREIDFEFIQEETLRTESGLRAIAHMYDDYSADKNSYDNILTLKDNIAYRLFSASHQYLVFLRELETAEARLQKLYMENPNYLGAFPMGNPYYDRVELELSSIFDNIIFQVTSLFDYLSHIICYISFRSKTNTLYWTKLAKAARGQHNELSNQAVRKVIDLVDRRFVGRLYDYRSRLIHEKRDKHRFSGTTTLEGFKFHLRFIPSELALKHFNLIVEDADPKKVTLTYLASWLLKRTFKEIERILDVLATEIRENSHFGQNLRQPKKGNQALLIVSFDPEKKSIEPASEVLWKQYKNRV